MGFGPGQAQDLGYFLASFAGDGLTGKEIEKPPERVRGRELERVWVPHSPEKDRRFIFLPRWWGGDAVRRFREGRSSCVY